MLLFRENYVIVFNYNYNTVEFAYYFFIKSPKSIFCINFVSLLPTSTISHRHNWTLRLANKQTPLLYTVLSLIELSELG